MFYAQSTITVILGRELVYSIHKCVRQKQSVYNTETSSEKQSVYGLEKDVKQKQLVYNTDTSHRSTGWSIA